MLGIARDKLQELIMHSSDGDWKSSLEKRTEATVHSAYVTTALKRLNDNVRPMYTALINSSLNHRGALPTREVEFHPAASVLLNHHMFFKHLFVGFRPDRVF